MSCHPKLLENIATDTRHQPMQTCIQCHSNTSEAMGSCGKDCFTCHDAQKIEQSQIQAHHVVAQCRACHLKVFLPTSTPKQSSTTSLQEMLFK
jgi:hypothetical protein